ncbi:hypothetical protein B0H13DRAFT_2305065 [Mycena leptocephala]|nr:hypothetical protein B0H13DRAFT_2305065 [Mycena leptocephala]
MRLVHVLEALGVGDAEFLAKVTEMAAHVSIAKAFPEVLGKFNLDLYFFVGVIGRGSQPLNGYLGAIQEGAGGSAMGRRQRQRRQQRRRLQDEPGTSTWWRVSRALAYRKPHSSRLPQAGGGSWRDGREAVAAATREGIEDIAGEPASVASSALVAPTSSSSLLHPMLDSSFVALPARFDYPMFNGFPKAIPPASSNEALAPHASDAFAHHRTHAYASDFHMA